MESKIFDSYNLNIQVNNLRNIIDKLAMFCEDLANNGPLKPEDIRGLSSEETIQPALYIIT